MGISQASIAQRGAPARDAALGGGLVVEATPQPGEWRLNLQVVQQIWARFGTASVDLCASKHSTHCHKWFSHPQESEALGLNSLAIDWLIGLLYAFPPIPFLLEVLF